MLKYPFREERKKITKGYGFGEKRDYGLHGGADLNGTGGGNTDCGYSLYPIKECKFVHSSSSDKGLGNIVVYSIEGSFGKRWVRYCHCSLIMSNDFKNAQIHQNEEIAKLGSTGNSTHCHLHWDIIKKPMRNWRTYAKNKETLNEYFEDPIKFIEKWKDDIVEPMKITPQTKIPLAKPYGTWEVQKIESELKAKDEAIEELKDKVVEGKIILKKLIERDKKVVELEKEVKAKSEAIVAALINLKGKDERIFELEKKVINADKVCNARVADSVELVRKNLGIHYVEVIEDINKEWKIKLEASKLKRVENMQWYEIMRLSVKKLFLGNFY